MDNSNAPAKEASSIKGSSSITSRVSQAGGNPPPAPQGRRLIARLLPVFFLDWKWWIGCRHGDYGWPRGDEKRGYYVVCSSCGEKLEFDHGKWKLTGRTYQQ